LVLLEPTERESKVFFMSTALAERPCFPFSG
jgi:hypothetical protein